MKLNKEKIKEIKGDASLRIFFRKKNNKLNSIIVYAKKEKKKNLLIYDCINKLLIQNKVLAPKLYFENYKENYIEIEDFGDESLYKVLNSKKKNKNDLLKKVIFLLKKIQKIRNKKIKNFNNDDYQVPIYSNNILFNESDLFCKWYIPQVIKKNLQKNLKKEIKIQIKFLISKIKMKNNFFVHRDFHVSNLIMYKKKNCCN